VSRQAPQPVTPAPDAVRMSAVHLGGVHALAPGQRELELRISSAGVQIYRVDIDQSVGTLAWTDIRTVRLPARLRLRPGPPRLVVSTAAGRACFALPGLAGAQVRHHLGPLLENFPGVRVR
jgi:hypothetical protein